MRRAWRWWGVWVCLGVCLAGGAQCREFVEGAAWVDGAHCQRTQEELDSILGKHRLWVETNHERGERADLHGANLRNAVLDHVKGTIEGFDKGDLLFQGADLSGAWLDHADLRKAYLNGADLTGTSLFDARLGDAFLDNASLIGAHLTEAHLEGASLRDADLTGADLGLAHLHEAWLKGTDLSGTSLCATRLDGATYEPKVEASVDSTACADELDKLRYSSSPAPLYALRIAFNEAGYIQQARAVTASIRRHDQSWLERALFDWTCEWGSNWVRPVGLLCLLCLVCGPIYWVGMHFGRVGGIYQIVLDTTVVTKASKELVTRVETGVRWGGRPALRTRTYGQRERRVQTQIPYGNDKKERQEPKQGQTQISREKDEQRAEADLRSPRKRVRRPGSGWGRVGPVLRAEWRALRLAFLFSVLSALDIGFHEFNVGVWARMLLARDFNLKARGWMRVAGGAQSLVGLGLVALSLLSYFGHPFD